ncbi:MAG TPA: hypothetical protein VF933_05480 [Streptosporangiaceae bacterium]
MRDSGTIWYRGAGYQLGRGEHGYAIWPAGGPPGQPLEQWPETPAGWSAAWSRFNAVEAPGTIVHLGPPADPVPAPPAGPVPAPAAGPGSGPPAGPVPGPPAGPGSGPSAGPGSGPPAYQVSGPPAAPGSWRPAAGPVPPGAGSFPPGAGPARPAWSGVRSAGPLAAAIALVAGVALGLAGLFPAYLSGASLAQQPAQLVPHVIYLAVWTASALLIASGGARQRMGALLAMGMSIVTFGFFFADLGAVISGGARLLGSGLVLGLAGWLACTAGSVLAFRLRSADAPRKLPGRQVGPVLTLAAAALAAAGAATSFAPSWDSYTLRTAAGLTHTLTAGNSFANPAPVIAGDVAVMVTLVAVVAAAALWRPVRLGAVLLAGAVIPMAAQAISALVQVSEPVSAADFGISPAQATQAGLTISTGLTAVFWIYCVFVLVLLMIGAWMAWPRRPVNRSSAWPAGVPSAGAAAPVGMPPHGGLVPGDAGRWGAGQ